MFKHYSFLYSIHFGFGCSENSWNCRFGFSDISSSASSLFNCLHIKTLCSKPKQLKFNPFTNSPSGMATYEGKPLMEHEDLKGGHEDASGCSCGCFRVLSLKWWQVHDDEGTRLLPQKEGGGETWKRVVEKLNKVKEASEVIAGPKWKTFIRKVSAYGKNKQKNNKFQYDERSYALNFNSGAQSEDDEDYFPPSFSTRFTAPLPAPRQTES